MDALTSTQIDHYRMLVVELVLTYAPRLLLAIVTLLVGLFVIRLLMRGVRTV